MSDLKPGTIRPASHVTKRSTSNSKCLRKEEGWVAARGGIAIAANIREVCGKATIDGLHAALARAGGLVEELEPVLQQVACTTAAGAEQD